MKTLLVVVLIVALGVGAACAWNYARFHPSATAAAPSTYNPMAANGSPPPLTFGCPNGKFRLYKTDC